MFESVATLLAERDDLQEQLSDPAIHADAGRAKKVNRRYAELSQIAKAHDDWTQATDDLDAARELAKEDSAFAEEIPALEQGLEVATEKLRRLLIPRDPDRVREHVERVWDYPRPPAVRPCLRRGRIELGGGGIGGTWGGMGGVGTSDPPAN